MNRATPQMRNFAKRLIAHEAGGTKLSRSKSPPVFPVSRKLQLHLVTLMGNAGFHALLSRALALAAAEVTWLRAVRINEEGVLEGWEKLHAELAADKFFEGRVVLLAQVLGLLVAFIGENLTLRMVREVWPKLPPGVADVGEGAKK